jgi:hypothetical protein
VERGTAQAKLAADGESIMVDGDEREELTVVTLAATVRSPTTPRMPAVGTDQNRIRLGIKDINAAIA